MATDHVAKLEKAHDQLVAQRRSLAEALAAGYQRGETERQMKLFRSIQGTLADIQEAILDERRRAPQSRRRPKEARFRIFRTEHREKQKSLPMTRLAASWALLVIWGMANGSYSLESGFAIA